MQTSTIDSAFIGMLPQADGMPFLTQSRVIIQSKLMEKELGGAFLGLHTGLDMPVLVRVMRKDVRESLSDFGLFIIEARRMARVRHPNAASIYDLGEFNGHPYVITEYVCGVPLIERLKARPLHHGQAMQMLLPIGEALCEFWRQDIVHRTISPEFIFLQCEGPAKLDITTLRGSYTDQRVKAALAARLTSYWSPEELRGDPLTPAADMWSFGATLYHAVTGHKPFERATCDAVRDSILQEDPVDPRTLVPDLPAPMRDLLLKLLSREPLDRFISGEAFLLALRSVDAHCSRPPHQTTEILPTPSKAIAASSGRVAKAAPSTHLLREAQTDDIIGQCQLVQRAGSGAFGVVYLARHTVLDIDVAVKLLPPDTASREPGYIDMFLREARTAARVRHPNVISIFTAGEQDGQYYLVMEYAPGGTVWDRMHLFGGTLPPHEVVQIIRESALGLSAAEKAGVVHRDIKPDNLMYAADGSIKIADLGLAKRRMPIGDPTNVRASIIADQLTMRSDSQTMAGTPVYMAPEIAVEPQSADTRADIYSLGISAYHMLTGVLPFEGKTPLETIMKHVGEVAQQPKELNPQIPDYLNSVIMKMIEKRPEDRYLSAMELADALSAVPT